MARGIKKESSGLNTDSSITETVKRARKRRSQLDAAASAPSNPIDDLNEELEMEGMSDYEKDVFEN